MSKLTLLLDALFAVLALVLLKNIFAKKKLTLIIPAAICLFSVATLILFYVCNTTEIINVWLNSHSSTPLIYKICGIWGNHEGSMLLFFTFLNIWSALLLKENNAITIASFFLLALGAYVYFKANPFVTLEIKLDSGQDLSPALQNPYLTIHPPILYLGQTLCFVLWIWSIFSKDNLKLYTNLCFGLMTLGLILGARWAYSELGWGGFWYWDPVETVSLFPWLTIVAAAHGKSNRTALLLSFPMVMTSMCLVRSGVLVSIHSFGFDLQNGIWIGTYTCLSWIVTLISLIKKPPQEIPNITIGFLIYLSLLVSLILFPITYTYFCSNHFIIDENFFHQYISPITVLLLIMAGFAPNMKITQHSWSIICALTSTILWYFQVQLLHSYFAIIFTFISFWLIFSSIKYLKLIWQKGFVSAHLGIGLCILGASHSAIFTEKIDVKIKNMPTKIGNYKISYKSQELIENPQIRREIIHLLVNAKEISPELQFFHISRITKHQSTWIQINLDHFHATIYADHNNIWQCEIMLKPMIALFWFGLMLVIFGICISILKSRKISSS